MRLLRADDTLRSATRQTRGMSLSYPGSRCGNVQLFRWCEEETDALEFLKQITQRHRDTRNSVPAQHAYDGNLQQNRFSYDVFVNYRDQTDGSTVLLWLPKWPYAHREACTQHGHRDY